MLAFAPVDGRAMENNRGHGWQRSSFRGHHGGRRAAAATGQTARGQDWKELVKAQE
jgi:hypothetical protein